jgi:hypothetical protein
MPLLFKRFPDKRHQFSSLVFNWSSVNHGAYTRNQLINLAINNARQALNRRRQDINLPTQVQVQLSGPAKILATTTSA